VDQPAADSANRHTLRPDNRPDGVLLRMPLDSISRYAIKNARVSGYAITCAVENT